MAIAFVQATGAQSSGAVLTLTATFSGASTSGNLITVGVVHYLPGTYTVSDTVNTYTSDVSQLNGASTFRSELWHTYATTGATLTVTVDNSGLYKYTALGIAEFSGADSGTSPLTNGDNNGGSSTTTPKAGSVDSTSLGNGALYCAVLNQDGATTSITEDGGFSVGYENESGSSCTISMIYQVQGTAGALNPGWTLGASRNPTACVAVFKASAGGAATPIGKFVFAFQAVQRAAVR